MWETITEKMVGIGPAVLESIAANQKKVSLLYNRRGLDLKATDHFLDPKISNISGSVMVPKVGFCAGFTLTI